MEIFLDERLTNKFSKKAFRTIESSIDLLVLNYFETSPLQKRELKEVISEGFSLFGGLYLQILEKLPNTQSNKIASANIASQLIMDKLYSNESNNEKTLLPLVLNYSTNNKLLVSSIQSLKETSWDNPKNILSNHFFNLYNTFNNLILKYDISNVMIKTRDNKIIRTSKPLSSTNDKIIPLKDHIFNPVHKKDIVGNTDLIDVIENKVSSLLHYNIKNKENIFQFNKYNLFYGVPGTGKTFLARYALTYAKKIADKNNIPLKIVKLDFEDRWQNGPLENIKYQFDKILSGDKPYIIFIDELDLKFPSRANNNSRSQEQVLREFLKFRGDAYTNFNNYLFLATTNREDKIDPALKSVFAKYELKPSESLDEKIKVFQIQIKNEIIKNSINWNELKPYLKNQYITNRTIQLAGEKINEMSSGFAKTIPYNISNEEKKEYFNKLITKNLNLITTDFIVDSLNKFIVKGGIYEI